MLVRDTRGTVACLLFRAYAYFLIRTRHYRAGALVYNFLHSGLKARCTITTTIRLIAVVLHGDGSPGLICVAP